MSATIGTYRYTARDAEGKTKTGTLDAPTERAAYQQLRQQGMVPVQVRAGAATGLNAELKLPGLGDKVGLGDLALFSRQFATMINSGLSLIRALNILADQTDNKKLAEILGVVRADVQEGASLSGSLAKHKQFPKLYIAMVRAGETAGLLDSVLLRVAATLESDLALRRKIKSAMTYPVVVLVLAVILTVVMLLFIVPTFVGMFESLGGELPLPTKILLAMSAVVRGYWWALLLVPIAVTQGFKRLKRIPEFQFQLDRLKLRAPVFGPLFHKVAISRFARNLGILLKAGVPILSALEITAETVNNGVISNAVDDVRESVKDGEAVAAPLATHPVFPPMVVQMMAVGEETGALDEMLTKISDFYDDEVTAATESLTAALEPIMIVVLASIVGAMVVALYMPMFKIFDLVQ